MKSQGKESHQFFACLLIPLFTLAFLLAQEDQPANAVAAQSPAASSPSNQEQLIKELLTYYQTQNKKSDSGSLNWTSIVSVVGALIAAVVALLSLYVNNRTSMRNQRDTQFFEALKRFGDKDSPTVRASAAGTIALLGPEPVQRWKRPAGKRLPRREETLLYYETAVNQLMTGLILEENPVTLTAISDATQKLVRTNPRLVLERVHRANLKLQKDLVIALAEFFAAMGIRNNYDSYTKLSQAALVTAYEQEAIDTLMTRHTTQFDSSFEIASQVFSLSEEGEKMSGKAKATDKQELDKSKTTSQTSLAVQTGNPPKEGFGGFLRRMITGLIQPKTETLNEQPLNEKLDKEKDADERLNAFKEARLKLSIAAERLRANVEVYGAVLRADPFKAAHHELGDDLNKWDEKKWSEMDMNLENAFLVQADLHEAKLDGVNFAYAQLQMAKLWLSSLRKAILRGAHLQGAEMYVSHLEQADMTAADLRPFELKKSDGETWSTRETDISSSQLQGVNLSYAHLEGADLTYSYLEGANLSNSHLLGTKFFRADIDDETNLDEANWWHANYYDYRRAKFHVGLLQVWYQKYGDKMPDKLEKLHPSIRQFVSKQKQAAQKPEQKQEG